MARIQFRLAPAQKAGPSAASTTARTSSRWPTAANASVISAITTSLKALRISGWLRVMVATPAFTEVVTERVICSASQGLHAEHTKLGVFDRGVAAGGQAQGQHAARVGGVDHAIVPQAGAGVVGVALLFVLLADRGFEGLFFFSAPGAALALDAVALDGGQHAGRLLAAHDRDARVGPHPQKAWAESAPAHAVVACAKAAPNHHGELGHTGRGHRRHQLGTVSRDAFVLVLAPDHEAGDVLQKHQRNLALTAQLDEVRALDGGLAEQNAVVGDDAHLHAFNARKAAHQRAAKAGLELVELAAIDDADDDLAHVKGLARVGRNHTVQLFALKKRSCRRFITGALRLVFIQIAHQ